MSCGALVGSSRRASSRDVRCRHSTLPPADNPRTPLSVDTPVTPRPPSARMTCGHAWRGRDVAVALRVMSTIALDVVGWLLAATSLLAMIGAALAVVLLLRLERGPARRQELAHDPRDSQCIQTARGSSSVHGSHRVRAGCGSKAAFTSSISSRQLTISSSATHGGDRGGSLLTATLRHAQTTWCVSVGAACSSPPAACER